MLSPNSILARLPPNLDRRQTIFLDGIRHALEIAALAYGRLQNELTAIALRLDAGNQSAPAQMTAAFLDAWAFVDAIDRFRSLLNLMPGVTRIPRTDGQPSFHELTEPLRNIRNVADHLAQRVDYVIAKDSTALGILTWFTVLDFAKHQGLSCMLLPGTVTARQPRMVNPAGQEFDGETGLIHLAAGEYLVSLSDLIPEITKRVTQIEASLAKSLADQSQEGKQAGADLTIAVKMVFPPEE
jgi:hypothetical protein